MFWKANAKREKRELSSFARNDFNKGSMGINSGVGLTNSEKFVRPIARRSWWWQKIVDKVEARGRGLKGRAQGLDMPNKLHVTIKETF